MSTTPAIRLQQVDAAYASTPVLSQVSVEVPSARLTGLIGPNGAGKSTLIAVIMGVLRPSTGTVEVLGQAPGAERARVAWVPQRATVDWDFPITVRDVVAQGRYPHLGLFRRQRAADREAIAQALERTAMTELADRRIGELSGGQQQRVFLARALAQQADVYLLDEPFAGVDAATEASVMEVLRGLRDEGRTVLVVHHDLATVQAYFEHLILLNRAVIASGPVAEIFTTEHLDRTYGGRLARLGDGHVIAGARP